MISIISGHPFMTLYCIAALGFTVALYLFPVYTENHLFLSGELNAGTFVGTLVHKDMGHYLMNLVYLIPAWIYADNKLGTGFVLILVLLNMTATGLIAIFTDSYMCGASGVVHFLIGVVSIIGNILVTGIGTVILVQEIMMLGQNTIVSHKGHVISQIAGILTGIVIAFCRR